MNSFFQLRHHSGFELVLSKSNLDWLTVKLLFNLSTFDRCIWIWYTDMEIIIPLYLSLELFRCYYNPMPLHSSSYGGVPIHLPDSLHATWPFGGLLPTIPLCPKSLMNFPWYKMPPANGIFYFVSSAFYFRTCTPLLLLIVVRIRKISRWVVSMFQPSVWIPKTSAVHTLLVLCQINFLLNNFIEIEK